MIDTTSDYSFLDIIQTVPYTKQILRDDEITQAIYDLQKVFCCSITTPEIFIFKDYDPLTESAKVSYTSESNAKSKLKKIIIGKRIINEKAVKMSLWDWVAKLCS